MSAQTIYDIGDLVTVVGRFKDEDGTLTDPGAITIKVGKPDDTIVEYDETDCTNPSVGIWRFRMPDPLDQSGRWVVKFFATSGLIVAEDIVFKVSSTTVDV